MIDPDDVFITEERIEGQTEGPLDGVTVAVKDNISTDGVRTTCGSTMLADYVPPFDATVVSELKAAGATIVGKTNMDEFGMGSTTETSAFGPTPNPVDPERVPGGSSGGSAAAVAAGMADVALGTDTGGSVRCPAAFCGVVGIKTTYGLVSRYGLIAYGNSLEQIGPLATSVEDAARVLEVIAGPDDRDATTRADSGGAGYVGAVDGSIDGMTIGIPTEMVDGVSEEVAARFESAMDDLRGAGAATLDVSLPSLEYAVPAYYVIAMSEASSNLARYDGVRYGPGDGATGNWNEAFASVRTDGFGEEVIRRILLGTFALSAGYQEKYYGKAQDARRLIRRDFLESLEDVDVLASPTMPVTPYRLGEAMEDPLQMYLADINTVPVNLANLPAISVPTDDNGGLPVGCQFIGPEFGERKLISVGSVLERLRG